VVEKRGTRKTWPAKEKIGREFLSFCPSMRVVEPNGRGKPIEALAVYPMLLRGA